MGYYVVMSPCAGCGRTFGYHPHRVPSIRVRGVREPVCKSCIDRANIIREQDGLPPLVPLPGAYEPCDESEL